jgi:hypothetical protein
MPGTFSRIGAAAVMMALAPAVALAQLRSDKFRIQAGWFLTSSDSKLRVDSAGTGTEVNLSDDLGVPKRDDTYLLNAEWRFAERHRLAISYFEMQRAGTRALTKDVTIADTILPAGSSATTTSETTIVPITYSYSFIKSPDSELAVTLAVHWTEMRLRVRGLTSINTTEFDKEASAKAEGPLPLLGLRYDYAFTPEWRLLTHAEYFYLKSGGDATYKGSMLSLRLATEYDLARNLALGLSYTHFAMDVDADKPSWKGRIEFNYHGPSIYVVGRF